MTSQAPPHPNLCAVQISSEHDNRIRQHIRRVSAGKYLKMGVILAVAAGKFLHDSVDLLCLPWQTKLREQEAKGCDKLHATEVHLVHVGVHYCFAVAVRV